MVSIIVKKKSHKCNKEKQTSKVNNVSDRAPYIRSFLFPPAGGRAGKNVGGKTKSRDLSQQLQRCQSADPHNFRSSVSSSHTFIVNNGAELIYSEERLC